MKKKFKGLIWNDKFNGKRVEIDAIDITTARELLEKEYGKGTVFNLHDPINAERLRQNKERGK